MSLFAGLKEKFADKLAEFKSTATPADPADKHALDLVEAATSDELIAPDWSLNFNVIDFVNSDVSQNTGRALKAIKRSLAKPNTKVQLLSLTLLEGCVKNCPIEFHGHLAASDLWVDVVKLAGDTSITRVDAEVRDKVLGMVEDFSRLQPTQFQAAYGSLLDRGVDFPIRAQNESVPLITPPAASAGAAVGAQQASATVAQAQADGAAGGDVAASAGVAAAAAPTATGAGEADPLAGVDEQDRAAIQAALAELEAEAQAAQEAARIAAEADAAELRQQRLLQQHQQQAQLLLAQQQQPQEQQQQQAAMEAEAALGLLAAAQTAEAAAAAQTAAATATATATADGVALGVAVPATYQQIPHQPQQPQQGDSGAAGVQPEQPQAGAAEGPEEPVEERVAKLLETANNTTLLLSEMLASVPESEPVAVREPYVAEVADTCVRLRSRLERDLVTLSDEALLASALSQHEELSRVLLRYDELLAAAEAVAPTVPRNAAAVALSHAAASRGVGAATAGAGGYSQPSPPMLQRQTLQHSQQQGQQHHPAAGTETAGQKVAAVAAALKERFAGAFDKLMAAAAAARAPGALPPSTGAPAAGAVGYAALGAGGGSGGASPTSAAAGPGAFTLLDDDDEETNEGTALIAKRTAQPNAEAQLAALQAQGQQQQMEQLLHAATAAVPPLFVSPPPQQMATAGPDLINFDDEAPPQAPAAEAPPVSEQHPAAAMPPFIAIGVTQSGTGDLNDLLSGLTVHAPVDAAGAVTAPLPTATAATAEPAAPLQPPPAAISRNDSAAGDQLVETLDRLVSQSSDTELPVAEGEALAAVADVGAGEPSGAAPALMQESQLPH